jgi:hypothetical protein
MQEHYEIFKRREEYRTIVAAIGAGGSESV